MNIIEQQIQRFDVFQQKHPILGFPIGVIKKFGDDDAGYQAALITYYGFLSLFPLLLVVTSVVSIASLGNETLQRKVMEGTSTYFPIIGEQLARNIQASNKSGVALAVGLVLAFYGARGGADAFRKALYFLWRIPKKKRTGFPASIFKSLIVTSVGGLGLIIAAILSASTQSLGRLFIFKILSWAISLLLLIPTFYFIFKICLPVNHSAKKSLLFNATLAAIGIFIVQGFGGYLVANQLRTLSPLYGTFALVLGLLFWIYLQAVIVLYTVEITIVREQQAWPRSITGKHLTKADARIAEQPLV